MRKCAFSEGFAQVSSTVKKNNSKSWKKKKREQSKRRGGQFEYNSPRTNQGKRKGTSAEALERLKTR